MQYPADRHPVLAASYWLPPLTLLVLIYLLSSGPVPSSIPTFKFMDKLAHACVFSALAFLLMRAFISGRRVPWRHDRAVHTEGQGAALKNRRVLHGVRGTEKHYISLTIPHSRTYNARLISPGE